MCETFRLNLARFVYGVSMKFLVLGVGSIGCRHIRNLLAMGYSDITAYDVDLETLELRCKELGISSASDLVPDLNDSDAVIICSPPSAHVSAALVAVDQGKFILVEKPVSNVLSDAKQLLGYQSKIMVGYNMRYHPIVLYLKELLPQLGQIYNVQMEFAYCLESARPDVDYRKGYYAIEGEGGVLLDHIHELDYAHYLFGKFSSVYCSAEKISGLEIESEDNANLILRSVHGFTLALHIDYLQQRYARNIKIIAENGVLFGDLADGLVRLSLNGSAAIDKAFSASFDQTYIDEITDFIAVVKGLKQPVLTVDSTLHSLEISHAARESSRVGRVIHI